MEIVGPHLRSGGGRPLAQCAADRPVLRRFGPPPGEQVVVRRRSDESVELHCHGGLAAVAMIESALVEQGARAIDWRDWIAGRHQDPITVAARAALAEARTERTAAILLDQYHGALRRAIGEIEQAARHGKPREAASLVETLLGRAELGRHLVCPWRVAIAGRPNVGKSSLINAMAGYSRAIVHPAAGTTRDVVTLNTAVCGWPIQLRDTAGLHDAGDELQRAGVELAEADVARADLVMLVFDAARPWSAADRELLGRRPDALIVHNKSDLPAAGGSRPAGLSTSALLGTGIEALADAIATRLVPDPPPTGAAVPFSEEQIAWGKGVKGLLLTGEEKAERDS